MLAAQLKRTQLAMKYDPSYPLVQEADQEVAQTQAAIAEAEKAQYMNQTTDRDPTYELSEGGCCQDEGRSCFATCDRGGRGSQYRLNEDSTRRFGSEEL